VSSINDQVQQAAIHGRVHQLRRHLLDLVQDRHLEGRNQEQIAQARNQAHRQGIQSAKIHDDPWVDRPREVEDVPDSLAIRLVLQSERTPRQEDVRTVGDANDDLVPVVLVKPGEVAGSLLQRVFRSRFS